MVNTERTVESRSYNYKMVYIRALGVIAVVLAHADLGGLYMLPVFSQGLNFFSPFSFMIPVFFFVSGYFFMNTPKILIYVKKRFKRLVVPYYGWNLFYALIFLGVTTVGLMQMSWGIVDLNTFFVQPWIEGEQFVFNLAMWFVLTLFLVQILYAVIRKVFNGAKLANEYLLFALCLSLGLSGTFLASIGWTDSIYLVISRTLFALPFVSFGFLYKVKLEKFDTSTALNIVVGAVLLLIIQFNLLQFYGTLNYDSLHGAFHGRVLQPFFSSFTGIWLCLQISKVFAWCFSPKTWPSKALKYVGDKSWDIMLHQFLGFWLLSVTFLYLGAVGFDSAAFKTNIYYRYSIGGLPITEFLYVLVGLVFPLVFSYLLSKGWVSLREAFYNFWLSLK